MYSTSKSAYNYRPTDVYSMERLTKMVVNGIWTIVDTVDVRYDVVVQYV